MAFSSPVRRRNSRLIRGTAVFSAAMMLSISVYGVSYWLPTLVKGFGVSNTTNGLLNIIPWLMATIVLVWLPSRLRGAGNRAIVAQPYAWILQTDLLGHWRAEVFVRRKEIDAISNVAPPRATLG